MPRVIDTAALIGVLWTLTGAAHAAGIPWRVISRNTAGENNGWAIGHVGRRFALLRSVGVGRRWRDVSPPGFWPLAGRDVRGEGAEDAAVSFLNARTGTAAVIDRVQGGRAEMRLASTADAGRHWRQTRITAPDWVEGLHLQFADAPHGFLLLTSGPAAGLMDECLYRTTDAGRTWRKASDISGRVGACYPTGVAFRNAEEGWIAATYHGAPDVPLYRTIDGGVTWRLQRLPLPTDFRADGYGDTRPPRFFGPGHREGLLSVAFTRHEPEVFAQVRYATHDGGRTWHIRSERHIRSYE